MKTWKKWDLVGTCFSLPEAQRGPLTKKLTLLDRSQRNRVCAYYWVDRDTKHLGHKHRYFGQWFEYFLPKHQPSQHIRHCKLALLCSVIFCPRVSPNYNYLMCLKYRWIRVPLQDRSHSMISHNWSHHKGTQFHNSPYKDSSKYSWSQRFNNFISVNVIATKTSSWNNLIEIPTKKRYWTHDWPSTQPFPD